MQDQVQEPHAVDLYVTPQVIQLDKVAVVTLGKYAEDSAGQGKYFE
ncbi:MAG: lasso RiPP family leader peptide-containing protein [Egibacteraceae bacterium]